MTVTAAALMAWIASCASVDPRSDLGKHLIATVATESHGDPLAIGVNADPVRGLPAHRITSTTPAEASAKAATLLAQGRSIDLGLFQINDIQLARHHLTLATAFDPCANTRAGAEHLADDFRWATAHSLYNTGSPTRGAAYAQAVMMRVTEVPAAPPPAVAIVSAPPPCAPAWDGMALAHCNARRAAAADHAAEANKATSDVAHPGLAQGDVTQ